jgi:hypothetical protein
MLQVIRAHRIAHAERMKDLCTAIAAGAAPAFSGEKGLPAFNRFQDRMTDIAYDVPAGSDTAAEDRAWAVVERLAG